jgi:hypothetical protein
MPREKARPQGGETVNIWLFALPALAQIQEKSHAKGMPRPSRDDAASAAVWAMALMPPEVCKATIEAFIAAEREAHSALAEALGAFFRRP